MKLAQLPTGHVIGFPDDAQDPHIDTAVQHYMVARGDIPKPIDPIMEMLKAILTLQAQMQEMQQQHQESTRQLIAALTAPKRIVHDANGHPVGLAVGN